MVAYVYDGTFDGVLNALFHCFKEKQVPDLLTTDGCGAGLGGETVYIANDPNRTERVARGLVDKAGTGPMVTAYHAFLAEVPRETAILHYLILAVQRGKAVENMVGEEPVQSVLDHCRKVRREAHKYQGFVRFQETSDGGFYAPISPKHQILPLLGSHFARRLSDRPWIIHDRSRSEAVVYDGKRWRLTEAEAVEAPEFSGGEEGFQKMWKVFFNTVAIKERIDYKRQRNFVPLYCRNFMNEFNPD